MRQHVLPAFQRPACGAQREGKIAAEQSGQSGLHQRMAHQAFHAGQVSAADARCPVVVRLVAGQPKPETA